MVRYVGRGAPVHEAVTEQQQVDASGAPLVIEMNLTDWSQRLVDSANRFYSLRQDVRTAYAPWLYYTTLAVLVLVLLFYVRRAVRQIRTKIKLS